MPARLRTWLAAMARRTAWERDLDDELASHVALRAADLVAAGVEPDLAQRRARLELTTYASLNPSAGDPALDAVLVRLRFAELGQPVMATVVVVAFDLSN